MNRLRITFKWLMLIIAVIAVDLLCYHSCEALERGFFSARCRRLMYWRCSWQPPLQGCDTVAKRPLSHVMFLLAGGIALIFHVYLVQLRPDFVSEFVSMIAGRRRGGNIVVDLLRFWLAVNALILVPALFVGWAAHDYRLKITT
jgi:hypothetical protein